MTPLDAIAKRIAGVVNTNPHAMIISDDEARQMACVALQVLGLGEIVEEMKRHHDCATARQDDSCEGCSFGDVILRLRPLLDEVEGKG